MYRFNRELMLDIRKFKISRSLMLLTLCLVEGIANASEKIKEDPVELRIQEIMKDLTLEQKVGQMVQGEIKWVKPSDVTKYHLGSILNGGGSFPNKNKNSTMQDWLSLADDYYLASQDTSGGGAGIPIVWGTDAVHGHNNVVGATLFPHNIGLGAANDSDLMKKIGEITAREVAVTGIDWVFAPTVAVAKDNRWGRTYEAYSSQSPIIKSYAGEIVAGLQGPLAELSTNESKVIATAKHFIGDGGTLRGVDQGDTIMSLQELLDEHGQGYYEALDAEVQTVMATFNSWNGVKIHGHKFLLTDVLKNQMGFDGFVVSDWMDVGRLHTFHRTATSPKDAVRQAVQGGIDMHMHGPSFLGPLVELVEEGLISEERIDRAAESILLAKFKLGLFEDPFVDISLIEQTLFSEKHQQTALDMAREGIVLLTNKNQILPLKQDLKVFVTGPNASSDAILGDWVLPQPPENITTVVEGIKSLNVSSVPTISHDA